MELMDLISDQTHHLHGTTEGSAMGCTCRRCLMIRKDEAAKVHAANLRNLMASARKNTVVIHYALAGENGGDRLRALPAMEV